MSDNLYYDSEEIDKKPFDNFFVGFFISALLTVVFLFLLSSVVFSFDNLEESLKMIYDNGEFVRYMIVALTPSMILFFFFYKTERWQSARGLIVAILLSMVLAVLK